MEGDMTKKLVIREEEAEESNGEKVVWLKGKVWSETKKIWVVARPAMFTRFSTFGINVITQAFVGHIGATQLAAYSLVYTVLLKFANGILVCLSHLSNFHFNFFFFNKGYICHLDET
jgi:MATE family multidrug resistance protein